MLAPPFDFTDNSVAEFQSKVENPRDYANDMKIQRCCVPTVSEQEGGSPVMSSVATLVTSSCERIIKCLVVSSVKGGISRQIWNN